MRDKVIIFIMLFVLSLYTGCSSNRLFIGAHTGSTDKVGNVVVIGVAADSLSVSGVATPADSIREVELVLYK